MTRDDLVRLHAALTAEAAALLRRKSHDYAAAAGDALGTLRACAAFGVSPLTGVIVRLSDKLGRLQTLAASRARPQVVDESVRDTVIDAINYAVLWYALYMEEHAARSTTPAAPLEPSLESPEAAGAFMTAYHDWCIGRFGSAPALPPDLRERVVGALQRAVAAARTAAAPDECFRAFCAALDREPGGWGTVDEQRALYRLLVDRRLAPDAPT